MQYLDHMTALVKRSLDRLEQFYHHRGSRAEYAMMMIEVARSDINEQSAWQAMGRLLVLIMALTFQSGSSDAIARDSLFDVLLASGTRFGVGAVQTAFNNTKAFFARIKQPFQPKNVNINVTASQQQHVQAAMIMAAMAVTTTLMVSLQFNTVIKPRGRLSQHMFCLLCQALPDLPLIQRPFWWFDTVSAPAAPTTAPESRPTAHTGTQRSHEPPKRTAAPTSPAQAAAAVPTTPAPTATGAPTTANVPPATSTPAAASVPATTVAPTDAPTATSQPASTLTSASHGPIATPIVVRPAASATGTSAPTSQAEQQAPAEDAPTATSTPLPTATDTPLPTATNTPLPTATNTPLPTATDTPLPTATDTPLPTATDTPLPTATSTPLPTATNTPLPTATNTPLPTATDTPLPTATDTPLPTATDTPLPTEKPNDCLSSGISFAPASTNDERQEFELILTDPAISNFSFTLAANESSITPELIAYIPGKSPSRGTVERYGKTSFVTVKIGQSVIANTRLNGLYGVSDTGLNGAYRILFKRNGVDCATSGRITNHREAQPSDAIRINTVVVITNIKQATIGAEIVDPNVRVDYLEMVIKNARGEVIWKWNEYYAGYCMFGGNDPCDRPKASWWNNLNPGTYIVSVIAYTDQGALSAETTFEKRDATTTSTAESLLDEQVQDMSEQT